MGNKNAFYWQHLILISTGDQQIDVSSYLTPESPHEDFTWEETDTYYVFKQKPTHLSGLPTLICSLIRKLHCLNPDSLTCLLLRKLNKSIDDMPPF